jgi:hypothetical protein
MHVKAKTVFSSQIRSTSYIQHVLYIGDTSLPSRDSTRKRSYVCTVDWMAKSSGQIYRNPNDALLSEHGEIWSDPQRPIITSAEAIMFFHCQTD